MINRIFLHVGFHKTASTSIQLALYKNRHKLANAGYLYPAFKVGNRNIINHSEVFYSMFCPEPEKYHMNLVKNYNTPEKISSLHEAYHHQLKNQINAFTGKNMVISGEGISQLNKKSLQALRYYLIEKTSPETQIIVITFFRHPVDWTVSKIQEIVKGGKSLQEAIQRNRERQKPFFKLLTRSFRSVFQNSEYHLIRFEDAVKHQNGITGKFLAIIGFPEDRINEIKDEFTNISLSYEATVLLSAIFDKMPLYIGNQKNPDLKGFHREFFFNMPGQKFSLPPDLRLEVWNKAQEDVNWLHEEMKFPTYQFEYNQENENLKWNKEVIYFIESGFLDRFDKPIKIIIINEILKETRQYWHVFSANKKIFLIKFWLRHSAETGLKTRRKRYIQLVRFIGITKITIFIFRMLAGNISDINR